MSYIFNLKASRHNSVPKDIEIFLDYLITKPYLPLPNANFSRKLGKYTQELKKKGLLRIYWNGLDQDSIAILKINNYIRPNSVFKRKGKQIEYVFEDVLIPRIKIPEIY